MIVHSDGYIGQRVYFARPTALLSGYIKRYTDTFMRTTAMTADQTVVASNFSSKQDTKANTAKQTTAITAKKHNDYKRQKYTTKMMSTADPTNTTAKDTHNVEARAGTNEQKYGATTLLR